MEQNWTVYELPDVHFDRIWALALVYLPTMNGETRKVRLANALGQATRDYLELVDGLDGLGVSVSDTSFGGFLGGHVEAQTLNGRLDLRLVVEDSTIGKARLPIRWLRNP